MQYAGALACSLAATLASCSQQEASPPSTSGADSRPNVLFVVWDTTRADRMSLYGHDRQTTPLLDAWASKALVFDDVVSAAAYTVPSHASMFTGLLPSVHCAGATSNDLQERHATLAELLRDSGYATFLYSENPHISEASKFAQGFERVEHPWSERHLAQAVDILRGKIKGDSSSELSTRVEQMESGARALSAWNVKAAGELAESALLDFLREKDPNRPFFAFVNYMEAHRPFIPPRRLREKFLTTKDVDASYSVDRSWGKIWEYTFGKSEFSDRDLELTRATYDASVLELDELFGSLIASLDANGNLDDTIVVLTADHGEHLGEQHMFDHQSSLYEAVLRVPLVISYPGHVPAGRRSDPVMNHDVFSTVLGMVGVDPPEGVTLSSRDLFASRDDTTPRSRLAEETTAESTGVRAMKRLNPEWDATPWIRTQRALYSGRYKWIEFSSGEPEMYDWRADPDETRNLTAMRAFDAAQLQDQLRALSAAHEAPACPEPQALMDSAEEVSARDRELLQALGYLPGDETTDGTAGPNPTR